MTTAFSFNHDAEGSPEGWLRDFIATQVPGLAADTTAYTRCTSADFLAIEEGISACEAKTAVGIIAVSANSPTDWRTTPIYNLTPPPGVLLRLGFTILSNPVVIDVGLESESPYLPQAASRNTTQVVEVIATKIQLSAVPPTPATPTSAAPAGSAKKSCPSANSTNSTSKTAPRPAPSRPSQGPS